MKPLHPSTAAASQQSAANLWKLKNAAFCRKPLRTLRGLAIAVVLQMGMLAGSAQTNLYLYSGSETNITLPPGTYIITAYGAPGGGGGGYTGGGLGAEMSAEFNFSASTTLTLLVGGGGLLSYFGGGGGGGGSFVVEGNTPLVIAGGCGGSGDGSFHDGGNGNVSTNGGHVGFGAPGGTGGGGGGGDATTGGGGGGFLGNGGGTRGGLSFESGASGGTGAGGGGFGGGGGGVGAGGGGSIIDSSAITNLTEISGIASPEDPSNGEIIITALPPPLILTMTVSGANFIVSWPTNYTGYILQQTVQLDNLNWVSLTLPFPPIISNGQFVFTVPAASLQPGFFRVRSP